MLYLYLGALAFGGLFLGASVVMGGGHGDADHGGGHDADHAGGAHDGGAHGHAGSDPAEGAHDTPGLWLPFLSLRFWTFAIAAFGLTGTLLTLGGFLPSTLVVALLSSGVGAGTGWGVAAAFRRLRSYSASSSVGLKDYVGASGRVLLPVGRASLGKVRLEIKDRTIDLPAVTEDGAEATFERGEEVMVTDFKDDHAVVTTPPERKKLPGARS
jgi:hypothetical protein